MSIFPDWIGIDVGTGVTTIVDSLTVDLVDDTISVIMATDISVEIIDDTISLEVC